MIEHVQLFPSLMCCNPLFLGEEINRLEKAGADGFHIDIMDGRFVKNFAMNIRDIHAISQITCLPLEVHLMIEQPFAYLEKIAKAGAKRIVIHLELMDDKERQLETIRSFGISAVVAITKSSQLHLLTPAVLSLIDTIMIMAVRPGFMGQPFLPETPELVLGTRHRINLHHAHHVLIEIDGAVSLHTLPPLFDCGARRFVIGTSGLFGKGIDYKTALDALRKSTKQFNELGSHAEMSS